MGIAFYFLNTSQAIVRLLNKDYFFFSVCEAQLCFTEQRAGFSPKRAGVSLEYVFLSLTCTDFQCFWVDCRLTGRFWKVSVCVFADT